MQELVDNEIFTNDIITDITSSFDQITLLKRLLFEKKLSILWETLSYFYIDMKTSIHHNSKNY